jgi:hypothetical protein
MFAEGFRTETKWLRVISQRVDFLAGQCQSRVSVLSKPRFSLARAVAKRWHKRCRKLEVKAARFLEAAMKTREVPRCEWSKFFDNLSRKQQGWEVTLEVFGPEIGNQVEERHMFLAGITAEVADGGDKIEIMMGENARGHVTHMITAPTLVELQQTDLGVNSALQIKSADGTTSLLHLR